MDAQTWAEVEADYTAAPAIARQHFEKECGKLAVAAADERRRGVEAEVVAQARAEREHEEAVEEAERLRKAAAAAAAKAATLKP